MGRTRAEDPTQEARERVQRQSAEAHNADKAEVQRLRALLEDVETAAQDGLDCLALSGTEIHLSIREDLEHIKALTAQRLAAAPAKPAAEKPPTPEEKPPPAEHDDEGIA